MLNMFVDCIGVYLAVLVELRRSFLTTDFLIKGEEMYSKTVRPTEVI